MGETGSSHGCAVETGFCLYCAAGRRCSGMRQVGSRHCSVYCLQDYRVHLQHTEYKINIKSTKQLNLFLIKLKKNTVWVIILSINLYRLSRQKDGCIDILSPPSMYWNSRENFTLFCFCFNWSEQNQNRVQSQPKLSVTHETVCTLYTPFYSLANRN